jgi:hypothetical protein
MGSMVVRVYAGEVASARCASARPMKIISIEACRGGAQHVSVVSFFANRLSAASEHSPAPALEADRNHGAPFNPE